MDPFDIPRLDTVEEEDPAGSGVEGGDGSVASVVEFFHGP